MKGSYVPTAEDRTVLYYHGTPKSNLEAKTGLPWVNTPGSRQGLLSNQEEEQPKPAVSMVGLEK